VEGLLYYLPHSAVLALFADIADLSAPGSRMVFDYLHVDALACGLSSKAANVPPAWTVTARAVHAKG
jgi:O-methyltransferase involved in polyketide biosynthesis